MMAIAVAQQAPLHYPHSYMEGRTYLSPPGRYDVLPSSTYPREAGSSRPSELNESGFPYLSPLSSQTSSWRSPPQRYSTATGQAARGPTSPFTSSRTPIRHSRPEIARNRSSSSRTNALLSYANEQSQQMASLVGSAPISISAGHEVSREVSDSRSYSSMPSASAYMNQQSSFYPGSLPRTYQPFASRTADLGGNQLYEDLRHSASVPAPYSSLEQADSMYMAGRAGLVPTLPVLPTDLAPLHQPLESMADDSEMLSSRQRLQCWDHGCNGRQFSTFSNLLRHQREKSGTATKARCPHCGTEFTRTTARNGHLYGGKCKGIMGGTKEEEDAQAGPDDPGPSSTGSRYDSISHAHR